MEFLIKLWMLMFHWVQFDVQDDAAEAEETVKDLAAHGVQARLRARTAKSGGTEYVLYVRDADRDLARHITGWII